MSPLTFKLKSEPPIRVDASPLIPSRLAGLDLPAISTLVLYDGRQPITAGDIFEISGSEPTDIRFIGDCSRLDCLGAKLTGGRILVEGNAGACAGSAMEDGLLTIAGNAGPYAGASMKGGVLRVEGNVGDHAAGTLPGEIAGMRGGFFLVRGNAGECAGDRMRRGSFVIEGDAGDYAGSQMAGGTLAVFGKAGALPGYLMSRGSILLRHHAELGPTFIEAGFQDFVWLRIFARYLLEQGVRRAEELTSRSRRYSGDMAKSGKGEILALVS